MKEKARNRTLDGGSVETTAQKLAARGLEVRPIIGATERAQLTAAAEADNHRLILPTHGVWRGEAAVGYASICATPCVHVWFSTKALKARDSFTLVQHFESLVRKKGHGIVIVPCWELSPFAQLMPHLGYAPFLQTTLYARVLEPKKGTE